MNRCYACKSEFGGAVALSTTSPGLCEECHRRTEAVKTQFVRCAPERFGRSYFAREGVDPPVWKPGGLCPTCGVLGQCYGWNQWTYREGSPGDLKGQRAEGD